MLKLQKEYTPAITVADRRHDQRIQRLTDRDLPQQPSWSPFSGVLASVVGRQGLAAWRAPPVVWVVMVVMSCV